MTLNQYDIRDSLIYERDSRIICYLKNKADKANPITPEQHAEWVRRFQRDNKYIRDWVVSEGLTEDEAKGYISSEYGLYLDIKKLMEG